MRSFRYFLLTSFACLALCFYTSNSLRAAGSDLEFHASYEEGLSVILFDWTLPGSPTNVQLEIYSHRGTVYFNSDFKLYHAFNCDTIQNDQVEGNTRFFTHTIWDVVIPHSFYAKAIYPDGSVKTSPVVFITSGDGVQHWDPLSFKTTPPKIGKIGQKYDYDADAESDNKLPVHFELRGAPDDATVEEMTGKISWTPTEAGTYHFKLFGWTKDDDYTYDGDYQEWDVVVPKCDLPSRVYGTVMDKDGKLFSQGYVSLKGITNGSEFHKSSELANGEYELTDLDEGEYYMVVYKQTPTTTEAKHCAFILSCGVEKRIDFSLAPPNEDNRITIKSAPAELAVIDKEYVYDCDASAKNKDLKIKYTLIRDINHKPPTGARIDENTGEFRWTPDSTGRYDFRITATAEENATDDVLNTYQYWTVKVTNCENRSKLTVTLSIHPDVTFNAMSPELYLTLPDDPDHFYEGFTETAEYKDKHVWQFENVDSGTYYLAIPGAHVAAEGYIHGLGGYWYGCDIKGENPTPIKIECGVDQEITVDVLPIEPFYYKVSGRVTSDDGKPIDSARIHLTYDNSYIGVPRRMWGGFAGGTRTNADGYYEFYADTEYPVVVSAYVSTYPYENNYGYEELYYNQSPSIDQAVLFHIDSPLENIDFVFPTHEKYNNSVSGKISFEGGSSYSNAAEMALYYVEPIDKYKAWKDYPFLADVDQEGNYEVKNLMPGKYIAFANPFNTGDYLSAYYRNDGTTADNWKDASRITVEETSEIKDINIELPHIKGSYGNGNVKGILFETKKKQIVMGMDELPEDTLRISGANVYLLDKSGERLSFGRTNGEGEFYIGSIGSCIYSYKIDKVGYDVMIINWEDAGDIKNLKFKLPSKGLYEKPSLAFCQISPNPAAETLRLDFTADGATRVSLVNSLGVKVYSIELGSLSGASTHSIELGSLPQGSYYAIIESGARASILPVAIIR